MSQPGDTGGGGAAEATDLFQLVGTTLENKFVVDRLVAEGGFGVVYKGTHRTLEKPIAIKVLKTPPEFNDSARASFIEKFALEAKTIARISHPNIVQVLDFGVSLMPNGERAPWMVLEWLTGQTLEDVLLARRGRGGCRPAEALALLRPVFDALAYAHEEGIAHRDIKPANIMVVQTKRGATLRLMDFGIAKLMDSGESAGSGMTRTRNSMNAFSPQYAAPEQISGTRTGPWTDVHALALIASEVLTDAAPYSGEDLTTIFSEVLSPVRPTPARRKVDAGPWELVLARALAIKPDDRYKNAAEFLAALEAAQPSAANWADATASQQAVAAVVADSLPQPGAPAAVAAWKGTGTAATTLSASTLAKEAVATATAKPKTGLWIGVAAVGVLALGGVGLALGGRGHGDAGRATTQAAAAGVPATNAPSGAQGTPPVQGTPQVQAPVQAPSPVQAPLHVEAAGTPLVGAAGATATPDGGANSAANGAAANDPSGANANGAANNAAAGDTAVAAAGHRGGTAGRHGGTGNGSSTGHGGHGDHAAGSHSVLSFPIQ